MGPHGRSFETRSAYLAYRPAAPVSEALQDGLIASIAAFAVIAAFVIIARVVLDDAEIFIKQCQKMQMM